MTMVMMGTVAKLMIPNTSSRSYWSYRSYRLAPLMLLPNTLFPPTTNQSINLVLLLLPLIMLKTMMMAVNVMIFPIPRLARIGLAPSPTVAQHIISPILLFVVNN